MLNMTTPREDGKAFAATRILIQDALTMYPTSTDYRIAYGTLLFQAGYEASKTGLDYDDAVTFSLGVMDHISDRQAEGRRRKNEGRA